MTAHIITIGDEILIGQIVDTNSAWMAQQLNARGIQVQKIITCKDTEEDILEVITHSFKETDLILTTGGLGPTKDDVTKKVLAKYFGLELAFHEETYARLKQLIEKLGRTPTKAHYEQCYLPIGIDILKNNMGTAPGMWFEKAGKVLVSMPGVPYEMKYLMTAEILPKISATFKTRPFAHRTVLTVGMGESAIAEMIEAFEDSLPNRGIKLAYLPSLGKVRLRLTASGNDEITLNEILDEAVEELKTLIPNYIYGFEKTTFEAAFGTLLKENELTIATAESCTGGLIAHKITAVSGASAYFKGSVVAYSNEVKTNVLGVKPETLAAHGAVSEATVKEMALGLLNTISADYAVAVSGIAGPDGGTPEKPVGTIWLAVAHQGKVRTKLLQLSKDRAINMGYTAITALNMVRIDILKRMNKA